MDKPLMRGLIGQTKNDKGNKKVKFVPRDKPDTSKRGVYRIERINYDVPMRKDKVMNANIKAHILSDEKMKELGFVDKTHHWELRNKVSPLPTMEEFLVISILKASEDLDIHVLDQFTNEIYDYQSQLYDDEFNEYANRLHLNVQEVMMKLVDVGVISGYERNDYI